MIKIQFENQLSLYIFRESYLVIDRILLNNLLFLHIYSDAHDTLTSHLKGEIN